MWKDSPMRSSNRTYLASVDHIRAFAAILIVFYHGAQLLTAQIGQNRAYAGDADWLYSRNPIATVIFEGHTAVALFMVLSGFIFTIGTLGHEVSFPKFMTNRLLRIYPLFLLLLLIGAAANPGAVSVAGLLQLIAGLGNLPGSMNLGPVSGMFWAIAVEMQFYLLFPLLNRLLTRFGVPTFARLLAAVVVVRALVWAVSQSHDVYHMLYLNLAGRIDQFMLGMIGAWLFVRHGKRFRGWWKVAVSVTLVVAALWAFNQAHGFASTSAWWLAWIDVEGGGWTLVILTYVATCRATNIAARAAAKVGELSYSIYLLHFVVLNVIIDHRWFPQVSGLSAPANALLVTGVVLLPLVLTISVVTYYGVEQPFLRLRVKYLLPAPPEKAVVRDSVPAPAVAAGPQAKAAHSPNSRDERVPTG
jgi:peptidoglycan/LPS O-acetylase OafA/YrhL